MSELPRGALEPSSEQEFVGDDMRSPVLGEGPGTIRDWTEGHLHQGVGRTWRTGPGLAQDGPTQRQDGTDSCPPRNSTLGVST